MSSMSSLYSSLTLAQRLLVLFGLLWLGSGLAHLGVWLASGMPSLEGPVTWRKPIAFGLSLGVLSLSLVWVIGHLPDDSRLLRQVRALVTLLSAELFLIDMQQWRGTASHFNIATRFDNLVFQAMGLLIIAAAAILAWWTWRLFRSPRHDTPREHLAAARAGMVLLAVGNLLGMTLVAVGGAQALHGTVPATVGSGGSLKLTHAAALHGLQVLPILAVLVGAVQGARRRLILVRTASAAYALLLGVLLWQAAAGRPPADLAAPAAIVLGTAVALLTAVACWGLAARVTRPEMPANVGGLS